MLISSQILRKLIFVLILVFSATNAQATVGEGPAMLFNAAISSDKNQGDEAHHAVGLTMVRFDTIEQCKLAALVFLRDGLIGLQLRNDGYNHFKVSCTSLDSGETLYSASRTSGDDSLRRVMEEEIERLTSDLAD